MNKNIENFTLNFPENSLKCKCDMDDSDNEDDNLENNVENNNLVEKFSNYDNSKIEMPKKLDRIYNIYTIVLMMNQLVVITENKYYYPIKPLNNEVLNLKASNSDKYKNIGTNNDKLLNNYNNNNIESYNYIFGINYEKNDISKLNIFKYYMKYPIIFKEIEELGLNKIYEFNKIMINTAVKVLDSNDNHESNILKISIQ